MHITQYPIQVYKDFEKAVGGSEPHFPAFPEAA